MNNAALFIGRCFIAMVIATLMSACVIGGLDLVSTIWHAVYPEYRKYIWAIAGSMSTLPAWKLAKGRDHP